LDFAAGQSNRAVIAPRVARPGEQAVEAASQIERTLEEAETRLLAELRQLRRSVRLRIAGQSRAERRLTPGQRIADMVAATMGSWPFIIIQSALLAVWIVLNVTAFVHRWDPYPFILLNLALSFQAAYAAPFIMMSQNRQQDIDRAAAKNDHEVNIKAELEIELLHQKLDELRQKEVLNLTQAVRDLADLVTKLRAEPG
jgi:uncharacterized membrane protein